MQTSLGHGDKVEDIAKSELTDKVEKIIKDAREHVKLESRGNVFDGEKKLTAEDLKAPQDPEEFTKRHIVEKIFDLLEVKYETGEMRFEDARGFRKVDYGPKHKTTNFLVEAKPVNGDLDSKSKDSAVNQLKGIFRLHKARESYSFGIATDGLRWIFISNDGEQVADCNVVKDFSAIEHFITGKEKVITPKKQAEVSKRFYQWYNALLHGGLYHDLEGKQRKISVGDCLVESVINVTQKEDQEEIAQVFINRLIFIKFLQSKRIIKEDVLEYLATLRQDRLDLQLRQLFFAILNTEKDNRADPNPKFAEIPYLNGSLFTRTTPEKQNPDYRIRAEVLQEVINFLDTFRFVSGVEAVGENIDPEILGYIFERAMTATDRKGTGAYYTPKYITQYICENTIYPYLLEKTKEFLKTEKGYKEQELPNDFNNILELRSLTLRDVYNEVVQKITVCDPACGSGAFLLAAADILFDIYRKIEDSLGKEGRIPDITLKKLILRDNIYGVDINKKGIEITKLRLWLWMADSYDPDAMIEALPNIEYNMRAGNSLVGFVDIGRFRETKVSIDDYLGLETPVMEHIKKRDELLRNYKLSSGKEARELKKQIEEVSNKIKQRLDIHLFQYMKAKKIDISSTDFAKLEIFHWGYEFHRVFENNGSGFSVVIGNPPYIQLQSEKGKLADLYENAGYFTFKRTGDIYCLFYEKAIQVLREGGVACYITSNKWMRAGYGDKLRLYLSKNTHVIELIDLGPNVFDTATVDTNILIYSKKSPVNEFWGCAIKKGFNLPIHMYIKSNRLKVPLVSNGDIWEILTPIQTDIAKKIKSIGTPLKQWDITINRGVLTGYNKAFVLDGKKKEELIRKDPKNADIIKPLIRGRDTGRYVVNFADKWLIDSHNGYRDLNGFIVKRINIIDYPFIKEHLDQSMEKIESRYDQGDTPYNLRNCAYHDEFSKEKIVWKRIGSVMRFSYDDTGAFCLDSTCIATGEKIKYLLGILNSKLILFELFRISPKTGTGDQIISVQALEPLLVPIPTDEQEAIITKYVDEIIRIKLSDNYAHDSDLKKEVKDLEKEIDQFVYKLYNLTPEEIKFVEGDS